MICFRRHTRTAEKCGPRLPCVLFVLAAAAASARASVRPSLEDVTVTGKCVSRTATLWGLRITYYQVVTQTEVYLVRWTNKSYWTYWAFRDYAGKRLTVTGKGLTLPNGARCVFVTRREDIAVHEDGPPWKGNVLLVVAGSRFSVREYETVKKGLANAGYKAVVASSKATALGMPEFRHKVDVLITAVRNLRPYRGIVFCGGPGIVEYEGGPRAVASDPKRAAKLKNAAKRLVDEALRERKIVGALSLAPAVVLAPTGALKGRRVTGSTEGGRFWALKRAGARYTGARVERDGNVVTAKFKGIREFSKVLTKALDEENAVGANRNQALLRAICDTPYSCPGCPYPARRDPGVTYVGRRRRSGSSTSRDVQRPQPFA